MWKLRPTQQASPDDSGNLPASHPHMLGPAIATVKSNGFISPQQPRPLLAPTSSWQDRGFVTSEGHGRSSANYSTESGPEWVPGGLPPCPMMCISKQVRNPEYKIIFSGFFSEFQLICVYVYDKKKKKKENNYLHLTAFFLSLPNHQSESLN